MIVIARDAAAAPPYPALVWDGASSNPREFYAWDGEQAVGTVTCLVKNPRLWLVQWYDKLKDRAVSWAPGQPSPTRSEWPDLEAARIEVARVIHARGKAARTIAAPPPVSKEIVDLFHRLGRDHKALSDAVREAYSALTKAITSDAEKFNAVTKDPTWLAVLAEYKRLNPDWKEK